MPISINEQLLSLSEAAKHLPALKPSKCKTINPATVWRWAIKGSRGIKLESILVGGIRCTSIQALECFLANCNNPGQVIRPVKQRQQEAVEEELAKRGY